MGNLLVKSTPWGGNRKGFAKPSTPWPAPNPSQEIPSPRAGLGPPFPHVQSPAHCPDSLGCLVAVSYMASLEPLDSQRCYVDGWEDGPCLQARILDCLHLQINLLNAEQGPASPSKQLPCLQQEPRVQEGRARGCAAGRACACSLSCRACWGDGFPGAVLGNPEKRELPLLRPQAVGRRWHSGGQWWRLSEQPSLFPGGSHLLLRPPGGGSLWEDSAAPQSESLLQWVSLSPACPSGVN